MFKTILHLSIITFVLFSASDIFCQNIIKSTEIEKMDISNEFLLNGRIGKAYIVSSNDSINNVVVRWDNGYFAIGTTTVERKVIGKWNVFDKKNRHREYIIFGFDAKCILYSKRLDKQGKVESEFKAITPCF